MSDKIWFDPTSDKWALSDGEHYLEVPHWAREIIVNEFERETRQLKVDNAKLRELVRVMAYCNQFRRDCDRCSMNGAAGIITERAGCDELLARLRELGVEVDA